MKFCFYISLLFIFSLNYYEAKTNYSDSLLQVLKTTREDSKKAQIYHKLFLEYEFSNDVKAKEYLYKALEAAKKKGTKNELADTYVYFGYFAEDKGNFNAALKNYYISLKINTRNKNKLGIADSHSNLGNVYYHLGNYPEALKHYFTALKIEEKEKHIEGITDCYNNIGNVYCDLGNYNDALTNYYASLKIKKKLNNKKGAANCYCNIGIAYYDQGNLKEALKNYTDCLKLKISLDEKPGIAAANINIGNVLSALAKKEQNEVDRLNKFNEVLAHYQSALEIYNAIADESGIAASCNSIGATYVLLRKTKEAERYLTTALTLSKKNNIKGHIKYTYFSLSQLDSINHDFKGAFENYKQYIVYSDSLNNEESQKKTIQSQMTYEFEKKEAIEKAERKKEIQHQKLIADERSRKQNLVLIFVISGLVIFLLFAIFIFRSLRITHKQKAIIEDQKRDVEEQKLLVEEKQKEIIDSIHYAKRIQRALLPTEKYIRRNIGLR